MIQIRVKLPSVILLFKYYFSTVSSAYIINTCRLCTIFQTLWGLRIVYLRYITRLYATWIGLITLTVEKWCLLMLLGQELIVRLLHLIWADYVWSHFLLFGGNLPLSVQKARRFLIRIFGCRTLPAIAITTVTRSALRIYSLTCEKASLWKIILALRWK